MKKIIGHIETQARNARFTHYDGKVVDSQLRDVLLFSQHFFTKKAEIDASRDLTPQGKAAARRKVADDVLAEIDKWKTERVTSLNADIGAQRTALVQPLGHKPEQHRVDFLLARLHDRTPEEISVLYGAATDEERQVMEAASASVGRIPMKTGRGLEWRPLLDPEVITEAVLGRAVSRNPIGAAKLKEAEAVRDMHATAASIAAAEIRENM